MKQTDTEKRTSPEKMREKPVCPYINKCGGCRYIDRPYKDQLEIKNKNVKKLLGDIAGASGCSLDKIVGADTPYYYRNKVHSVFSREANGRIIRGMYREDSHDVVNVSGCLLEDRDADAIIESVREMLTSFKIKIYDEDTRTGFLRHVLVRTGNSRGRKQIMVVLVTSEPVFPSKSNFIKELRYRYPMISTIVQNVNSRHTSMVLQDRNIVLYGKGYIEDELMGLRFRISPSSFYQINRAQTEKLYSLAVEAAGLTGREKVLDAYCGTGTIGMIMAGQAASVIGVELNRDAVKDAINNAKENRIENITFVNADATEYINRLAAKKEKIDIVCMDPPRSGSTPEFINAVAALGCSRAVYVSCSLETLARDLKLFVKKGYKPVRITPVDMFPGTEHVETVCLMSRKEN